MLVPTNDLADPAGGRLDERLRGDGLPAATAGKIALIQRGTCTFRVKADNATAAGAIGVVIFNEGNDSPTDDRVGCSGRSTRRRRRCRWSAPRSRSASTLATTAGATVHISVQATVITTESFNVIADTKSGNPNKTIVVGAHLDSVEDGPGINDNGSGSAAQLEIAEQMNRLHIKPKNRIRFAWWGAEEFDLLGPRST